MSHLADPFTLINQQFEEKENEQKPVTVEYAIEAYQIVRLKKMSIGKGTKREIIDTIYVHNGNSDWAQSRALSKAIIIGDCMVVEKSERVILATHE